MDASEFFLTITPAFVCVRCEQKFEPGERVLMRCEPPPPKIGKRSIRLFAISAPERVLPEQFFNLVHEKNCRPADRC